VVDVPVERHVLSAEPFVVQYRIEQVAATTAAIVIVALSHVRRFPDN